MAFFDFLLGGPAGQIKRHARRLANRDSQPEDREASAHWLSENGSEEALLGLFGRFSLQIEHGLKDRKEKDLVSDLLVAHGAPAAAVAKRWARQNLHCLYAVRVVDRIEGGEAAAALLLELLRAEQLENEFKPEKKRTLLIALAERRHPEIAQEAGRFLKDFDEGVRNAAVEAIAAQSDPVCEELLREALANPSEESTRIRGRLAEIFQQRKWTFPTA